MAIWVPLVEITITDFENVEDTFINPQEDTEE